LLDAPVQAIYVHPLKKYELIDHTADVGLRIFGDTLPALFENAGRALFDVIAGPGYRGLKEKRTFSLERDSLEELLVEWMGALLYAFDTEHFLFGSFSVTALDRHACSLQAEAEGDYCSHEVHAAATGVKAVTYHNLHIVQKDGRWEATVILDV